MRVSNDVHRSSRIMLINIGIVIIIIIIVVALLMQLMEIIMVAMIILTRIYIKILYGKRSMERDQQSRP